MDSRLKYDFKPYPLMEANLEDLTKRQGVINY